MKNYYLHRDGQNHGPYSAEQMVQLISSGQVGGGEPICEEGGTQWVQAGSLAQRPMPSVVGVPGARPNPVAHVMQSVAEEDVVAARGKLRTPIFGIVCSIALPCLFLAAKSDMSRGVRVSGKYSGIKALLRDNVALLPVAVAIGVIGAVVFAIWFGKSFKGYRKLKADYLKQSVANR